MIDESFVAQRIAEAAGSCGLTKAEAVEARRMVSGLSIKESASAADIAFNTVRQRRKAMYRKLGVDTAPRFVARLLGVPDAPPAGGNG